MAAHLPKLLLAVAVDSGRDRSWDDRPTLPHSQGSQAYSFTPPANAAVACERCAQARGCGPRS